ncbi:MAG: hypothetical protein NVS3B1_28280 [Marmoricola sp.]
MSEHELLRDLVSTIDIARLFGVGSTTVSQWKVRYETFPAPLVKVAGGAIPLYSRRAVVAWRAGRMNVLPSNYDAVTAAIHEGIALQATSVTPEELYWADRWGCGHERT